MTPSRIALAAAVLIGVPTLAACGGSSSEESAQTQACRSYLLAGGAGDTALIAELRTAVDNTSYDPGPLKIDVLAVRGAAAVGGSVKNLSDADFRVFRNLVAGVAVVQSNLTGTFDINSVTPLSIAVDAVHKLCG